MKTFFSNYRYTLLLVSTANNPNAIPQAEQYMFQLSEIQKIPQENFFQAAVT